MPFTIRNTMNFDMNGRGWKETWFSQQATGDLTPALNYLINTLTYKRKDILGAQAEVTSVEASIEIDDAGKPFLGDSALKDVGVPGSVGNDADSPDVAVLLRCSNSTRQLRRNVFVRGIWDSIDLYGGKFVPAGGGAPWQTNWNAWIAALQGMGGVGTLGAGWLHSSPIVITTLVPPTYKNPIVSAVSDADGFITITFQGDMVWPMGIGQRNRVRINTARVKSQLAGQLLVVPTSSKIAVTAAPIGIVEKTTTGWYGFTSSFAFQPITFYDPERITNRKVGKVSGVTPGRARARART